MTSSDLQKVIDTVSSSLPPPAKGWVCQMCGYTHEGDDAPEVCCVCGVGKDQFLAA